MALIVRFLQQPKSTVWILALFLLLISPVFFTPYSSDDFFQVLILSGSDFLPLPDDASFRGLFSFIEPPPADRSKLMQYSLLPWWTYEGYYFRFWRPLTEISHWFDYEVFGPKPLPAHIHNVLWFIALAFALWSVFKKTLRLENVKQSSGAALTASGSVVAALGFMLFVFDNSHAPTISWISNRNALMAATFALLCLAQHIDWRSTGKPLHLALALGALALSLLSAEASLAIGGYLFAYAVCLDRQGPRKGFIAILPYLLLVIIYLVFYKSAGFGSAGSSVHYVDPVSNSAAFLKVLVQRLPIFLFSCFGVLPAEIFSVMEFLNAQWGQLYWLMALSSLLLFCLIMWPLLRRNASLRFCLLGAVIAGIPVCALFPQDRLTLFISLGANGAIALVLMAVYQQLAELWTKPVARFFAKTTAVLFILFHLVLAPPLLWGFAEFGRREATSLNEVATDLPLSDAEVEGRYLVMVEAPLMATIMSTPLRLFYQRSIPDKVLLVSSEIAYSAITKVDDHTVEVLRKQGYVYKSEAGFRDPLMNPIDIGYTLDLDGIRLTVIGLGDDGRPNRVRIEFDRSLSGDGVKFLTRNITQDSTGFKTFTLPPVGETLDLE